jgi:AmmeMemoRadiSam system protein B
VTKLGIRKANYAGTWYKGKEENLRRELEELFLNNEFGPGKLPLCQNKKQRTIIGGISPHAGFTYSGCSAAHTYFNLFKEKIPDTIIILGNHHHPYSKVGIMKEGMWETPLGNLTIDSALAKALLNNSNIISDDTDSFMHSMEHNIEIQLPFIKYCAGDKDTKIIPMKIRSDIKFNKIDELCEDIAETINSFEKDIIIVASSDMSHYNVDVDNTEQLEALKKIDQAVIDQFLKFNFENVLNPEKFIDISLFNKFRLGERRVSICGRQTITSALLLCKKLNAIKSELLKYYISKDIKPSKDPWTVGYFSGIIIK